MKRIRLFALAIATVAVLSNCGGRQSVASKSAEAYRQAAAKGTPVQAGGNAHGGHAPSVNTDISQMDHSKMQHGSTKEMANMPGMQHGSMAGMDHPKMQHASTKEMAAMDHSKMQHGSTKEMPNMPGMPHGSVAGMTNMAGMQHGAPSGASIVLAAPFTSSGIAQLSPSSTLQPDAFDQPAPVAVQEANKVSSGSQQPPAHEDHRQ